MFRFHKTLDVITLFHKASSPASLRVHTLLKQASAKAQEFATEDQASDHSSQPVHRAQFDLEVTEEAPTQDQLRNILEYVGAGKASSVVEGADDIKSALRKVRENGDNFKRPLTVDWINGQAVPGDNESEILKMLDSLPKA